MENKKYVMIVTAEDERYGDTVQLGFFTDQPWAGSLNDIVFGDDFDELFTDGSNEGLFYQLYHIETGKRIGYGMLEPDCLREDLEEWEAQLSGQKLSLMDQIESAETQKCSQAEKGIKEEVLREGVR